MGLRHAEDELPPLLARVRQARAAAGTLDRPFDVWATVMDPRPGAFERIEAMGVTMTNGTHFLVDGKAQPSSLDFKKRRKEEFARRHMHGSGA